MPPTPSNDKEIACSDRPPGGHCGSLFASIGFAGSARVTVTMVQVGQVRVGVVPRRVCVRVGVLPLGLLRRSVVVVPVIVAMWVVVFLEGVAVFVGVVFPQKQGQGSRKEPEGAQVPQPRPFPEEERREAEPEKRRRAKHQLRAGCPETLGSTDIQGDAGPVCDGSEAEGRRRR